MKPSLPLIFLSLCTLASALPEKESFHLFLLAGQSNMAGRAELEPSAKTPIPKILALNKDLKWQPATDPLHWDKPRAAGGMGRPFAQSILKTSDNIRIGLIPAAFGGTSIREWTPSGELYQTAIRRAKIAMKDGTLKAILWHQGESDSNKRGIKGYEQNISDLITSFRKDLGTPDLPFVIGQLAKAPEPEKARFRSAIDDANRRVAAKLGNVTFVTSQNLTTTDGTHFDAPSIRTFGERYAAAFLELTETR